MILRGQPHWRLVFAGLFLLLATYLLLEQPSLPPTASRWSPLKGPYAQKTDPELVQQLEHILNLSSQYQNQPLDNKAFGAMGSRTAQLVDWLEFGEGKGQNLSIVERMGLHTYVEELAVSMFPFLSAPSYPENPNSLSYMRSRHQPGTRGLVIPTGRDVHFRFACHLVQNVRQALDSSLPIEIVYAGDQDLPPARRAYMSQLVGGRDIDFIDLTEVFDDDRLQMTRGGWSLKAFAALASGFEEVILVDADAVFLQKPEVILDEHPGYRETGALFFHDRLLWQNAFPERHAWWKEQMGDRTPSATLNRSRVWRDNYAEEQDSGVVVLNLGQTATFMGLMHVCWQNSLGPQATAYAMGYGDKETWWFGLELVGAAYAFEQQYGSIVGTGESKVCGFTIAHVDAGGRLLWYNGSLLRNKLVDPRRYQVPTRWATNGTWEKGVLKEDMSCMVDGVDGDVPQTLQGVVRESVALAKEVDAQLLTMGIDGIA